MNKELKKKIERASNLANKHRLLVDEIDKALEKEGIDVQALRNSDACGYVDTVDYGGNNFQYEEARKEYPKRED